VVALVLSGGEVRKNLWWHWGCRVVKRGKCGSTGLVGW
jgi:hypothetical protein